MLIEIKTACQFLTNYISSQVNESQSKLFGLILSTLLHAKYASHWDLKNPSKGNAYRAITIFNERLDSTILSAAQAASIPNIGKYLPSELCLWIDPHNVSYKIGDYGNIITLYESPESKTYSPKSSNSTVMTNNVSNSSSKSSKSNIHGNKHRNSMADIYVNKGSSQNGRAKKYNGNNSNNFAMKKNLSSNKDNNNNNYPKHTQNNTGSSGNKKNESQYHNTNSNNNDLTHKKEHKVKSPKITYQTKTSSTRELSPIAKSLRAQLIAQSRFNIPFLYPKENETTPVNTSSSSFMNDSSYSKPITMAQQILAN
jgi:protein Tob/BTG